MKTSHAILVLTVLAINANAVAAAVRSGQQNAVRGMPAGMTRTGALLERRARLNVEDVALLDALTQLQRRSGVSLVFSPSELADRAHVSCACSAATVAQALDRLLAAVPMRYSEVGAHVLIEPEGRPADTERKRIPSVEAPELTRTERALPEPLVNARAGVLAPTSLPDNSTRARRKQEAGTITGRVTDAATRAPLSGVSIVVEGTGRGSLTDASGRYRVTGVPPGSQRISAVSIGFKKSTQQLDVQANAAATANFALDADAIALDRIVVTGSVSESKVKAMASPITVVDSREIEERQIQRVDQLFRGAIPGAIAWDMGPYNYYSEISVRGKNSLYFDYIKTYVDGVEVASPLMLATIDPNQVERVEVVRGPQASTLYGSDAAGGVLQIFTKKGTPGVARPQINAKVSVGLIETDYVSKKPTTQEHSLSVTGGGQDFSYNFGGTYLTMGEYVPEASTDNTSAFGSARMNQGALTMEISGRYYTKNFGWPLNPILKDAGYAYFSKSRDETHNIRQSTVGINLGYQLRPNWRHTLNLGIDRTQFDDFGNNRRLTTPADTFLLINGNTSVRSSFRYNTTLDLNPGGKLTANLTAGFERSLYNLSGMFTQTALYNSGQLSVSNASLTRLDYGNTGYFAQGRVGINDALFVVGGVRVEDNQNFGADYGRAVAPRVGATYSRALSNGLDVKVRGSYGTGIRPPQPQHKQAAVVAGARIEGNPDIGPEEQKGWDSGVELYFGKRATLGITYYDQKAINLIDQVLLQPPSGPGSVPVYQYQNVGEMANSGWELEGTLNVQPFRFTGTFSTTNSTVEKLSPKYTGDLKVGDKNLKIPEQQAGFSVAYDFLRGSAVLDMTYIGSFVNTDFVALYGFYFGGQPYKGSGRDYWMDYDPVTRFNLRVEQAVTNGINAFVRVENLSGKQLGERDNTQINAGRMTVIGVRIAR